jgi:hypothetical protein
VAFVPPPRQLITVRPDKCVKLSRWDGHGCRKQSVLSVASPPRSLYAMR